MGHLIFVAIFSFLPRTTLSLNHKGAKRLNPVFRDNLVLGVERINKRTMCVSVLRAGSRFLSKPIAESSQESQQFKSAP